MGITDVEGRLVDGGRCFGRVKINLGGVSGQVGKEGIFLWHDGRSHLSFLVLAREEITEGR